MTQPVKTPRRFGHDFKTFFVRGLAIVLPTAVTIWLLVMAYTFVNQNIAGPLNGGVRAALMRFSNWPQPTDADFVNVYDELSPARRLDWEKELSRLKKEVPTGQTFPTDAESTAWLNWMQQQSDVRYEARLSAFEERWDALRLGEFRVLNLIGLILAVVLIYIAGILVTSFIGRGLYGWGERIIGRMPLVRSVYPAVKQVTDMFFGGSGEKINFSRVVAVQYPRMGIWSIGLVTGDTMESLERASGQRCLTVFMPCSPTPFTGYVIVVPKAETMDLPLTVEEALKFMVSCGVVVPPSQLAGRSIASMPLTEGAAG